MARVTSGAFVLANIEAVFQSEPVAELSFELLNEAVEFSEGGVLPPIDS